MEIMAAHYNPYSATATIGFPRDLQQKIIKAKSIRGTKFIHMLVPCPTGWKTPSDISPELSILAVETNVFPLYEVEDAKRYILNKEGLQVIDLPPAEKEKFLKVAYDEGWKDVLQKNPVTGAKLKELLTKKK
jgi:pyruvate/2-oxoacid:ferredoxin oxidoreductase beta subunit